MLVLSRKSGERILIGENIELTIVEVRGGKVRLGIDAPHDVSVHREEIYRFIQEERAAALSNDQLEHVDCR